MPPKVLAHHKAKAAFQSAHTEEDVQAAIMDALKLYGYEVLQTSEHRREQKCEKCGTVNVLEGGRGCSPGVPDLLVLHDDWPPLTLCGLEVKGPRTRISAKQQELARRHRIQIVYSVEEAVATVLKFENKLHNGLTKSGRALMMSTR